jgi:hypothetical protein
MRMTALLRTLCVEGLIETPCSDVFFGNSADRRADIGPPPP